MKKCQFWGIMDKALCKRSSTHRILSDGKLIGEVCGPHEVEMRKRYAVTSEPKRQARKGRP